MSKKNAQSATTIIVHFKNTAKSAENYSQSKAGKQYFFRDIVVMLVIIFGLINQP